MNVETTLLFISNKLIVILSIPQKYQSILHQSLNLKLISYYSAEPVSPVVISSSNVNRSDLKTCTIYHHRPVSIQLTSILQNSLLFYQTNQHYNTKSSLPRNVILSHVWQQKSIIRPVLVKAPSTKILL